MSLYFVSGFLTNFISAPVISAFTSAVSINVMTSQVKGLLGLKKVILNPSSFDLYARSISISSWWKIATIVGTMVSNIDLSDS